VQDDSNGQQSLPPYGEPASRKLLTHLPRHWFPYGSPPVKRDVRPQSMRYSIAIAALMIALAVCANGQSNLMGRRIQKLSYDAKPVSTVFADLERISRELDPTERGIRFAAPGKYWGNATVTISMSNLTYGAAVADVASACGLLPLTGHDIIYLCGFQMSGPPQYGRSGITGRVIDESRDEVITNAQFTTWPAITNRVAYLADGTFVACIDYYVNRPFVDGHKVYRPEDDVISIKIEAPGFGVITQEVDVSDGSWVQPITVKMRPNNAIEAYR
jgi:hypothetical protein